MNDENNPSHMIISQITNQTNTIPLCNSDRELETLNLDRYYPPEFN